MSIRKLSLDVIISLVLFAGAGAWTFAQEGHDDNENDGEVEIRLTDAPPAVQAAIAKMTAAANVKKVIKETDEDITTYEVEFADNGAAVFSTAGDLMELEKATPQEKLPAALTAALKKDYPTATFADPQTVTRTFYEIEVVIDGKKHEVKGDAAGNIEDEHGGNARGEKDHHDKKHEGGKKGEHEENDND